MHVTLRQLQVFRSIATLGQVQLAAKQLHLSQPATSMALSELEKHLDCLLFDRSGNRLLINVQGKKLLPLACELLDRTNEITHLFSAKNSLSGKLTIGASTTIGNYLLPQQLIRFKTNHPEVDVELDIHNTTTIIERIASMELDIGYVEGPCQHPGIETIPWREDQLTLFCSSEHPLANKPTVTLKDLEQAHWILREQGSGTRFIFDKHIGQYLRQPLIKMELNQTEAIKNMVSAGAGISCLSELSIAKELDQGEFVPLSFQSKTIKRQFWLLLNRKKYRGDLVNALLNATQVSSLPLRSKLDKSSN
ncbi:LysR substrate-binding domain-containing protein [uncultured Endozoicomonas sp.]|uniref:LysR substrate-binding domain-containing protein n=1 Tax=uncultured Endozoicomonas sp. TaxID=432652 RepID=UPI0026261C82|nr:LysR substrate-binding domain-containing protein [uncultured Endozoicomonas sp.]